MTSPGPLLVTGGAGFVGAEVVRRAVAAGRSVHVLVRSSTDRSPLAGVEVHWHEAELEDERALAKAFMRAAASAREAGAALDVVHLAARISYRRKDRELLRRSNVEGTRRVLAAARAVGVRRLCQVSSVVALGPVADAGAELDDDAPLGGLRLDSAYARTKAEAEALALATPGLEVVVASPAVVFGFSGAGSNSLHFLRRVLRGGLGPLSPPGSLSVVGLEDAADGIRRVLEHGTPGRRYLLCESAWRLTDLLALACGLGGRRGPRGTVPLPVWRGLVAAAALFDRIAPRERVTPEALSLLGMHFRFRARRARQELGWSPRPIEEVLREILARLPGEGVR